MFFRTAPFARAAHSDVQVVQAGQGEYHLAFKRNTTALFNTYFNSLSIEKWAKYTNIGPVRLVLDIQGAFAVSLVRYALGSDETIDEYILQSVEIQSHTRSSVTIPYPQTDRQGILAFSLQSVGGEGVLFGGAYHTQVRAEHIRDVRIAIGMCTYRREPFVRRNMKMLCDDILDNPASPLYGRLEVFIADNGNTLSQVDFPNEHIHLCPNPNTGGSGGFARTMLEASRTQDQFKTTHIVLMDDDVRLTAHALALTYSFLRIVKDAYVSGIVGGAMLLQHKMNIQHAAGEMYVHDSAHNAFHIFNGKCGYDLNRLAHVLRNEIEESVNYTGWWYSCYPLNLISGGNLPMPFFFQFDDIEFSLRHAENQKITLNGICLWHENFDTKYSAFKEYFSRRNSSITRALHFSGFTKKACRKEVIRGVMLCIVRYRYREGDILLRATEDFLKGPDWLCAVDEAQVVQQIRSMEYALEPVDRLPVRFSVNAYYDGLTLAKAGESFNRTLDKVNKFMRLLSFNGWLLKANRDAVVPTGYRVLLRKLYRAKKVLHYDIISQKGYVTEKSYKEAFRVFVALCKTLVLINRRFAGAVEAYRAKASSMQSDAFWAARLGLGSAKDDGQ